MGFQDVGKVWDVESFRAHLRTVDLSWARGITMHHTAAPSLAQRPQGFKAEHIRNIADYYRGTLGWSRGPHLFVDEDQIWGMSPLDERGIHAVSFNATHIGIEVLGNYDTEPADSGRGAQCWAMAALAAAAILDHTGWSIDVVNGHRDDPRTSKSCPGKNVDLDAFRLAVLEVQKEGDPAPVDDRSPDPVIVAAVEAIEWQLGKIKRHLG